MKTIKDLELGTCIKLNDGTFCEVRYNTEIGRYYGNWQLQDENGNEIDPEEFISENEVFDIYN